MKIPRFSNNHIIVILQKAEAYSPVPEFGREHDISNATFYKCDQQRAGMHATIHNVWQ